MTVDPNGPNGTASSTPLAQKITTDPGGWLDIQPWMLAGKTKDQSQEGNSSTGS